MDLQIIQNKIFEVRGCRVMLDLHLAELYQVETRALKQAVRRNIERFEGDDFMFELSESEYNALKDRLRSQIVTLETDGRGKYPKYAPFAFTEMGVAMLSSVLRSDTAIRVNRAIMRAFVAMRQMLTNPPVDRVAELQGEVLKLKEYVEEVFKDQNDINEDTRMQLELVSETLAELQAGNKATEPRRTAGYHPSYMQQP